MESLYSLLRNGRGFARKRAGFGGGDQIRRGRRALRPKRSSATGCFGKALTTTPQLPHRRVSRCERRRWTCGCAANELPAKMRSGATRHRTRAQISGPSQPPCLRGSCAFAAAAADEFTNQRCAAASVPSRLSLRTPSRGLCLRRRCSRRTPGRERTSAHDASHHEQAERTTQPIQRNYEHKHR